MTVYKGLARDFKDDVARNVIDEKIANCFLRQFGYYPGSSERNSWTYSLRFMDTIIRIGSIPDDCGVLIEFNIPNTNKRIDFLITGKDENGGSNFVVVELKQWQEARATPYKDVVITFVGHGERTVAHPSYQAYSYNTFLVDMNTSIQQNRIGGHACAYLHNYQPKRNEPLLEQHYMETVLKAPIFFKHDVRKLQDYIASKVGRGNGTEVLKHIENGEVRPSKELIDCVVGLLKGNDEFILLDDQKVAFEAIMSICESSRDKTVVMVKGGPGTGKSVIALNVFGKLLQGKKNVRFVAPNAAFRNVMLETLVKNDPRQRVRVKNLFMGSASLWECRDNEFNVLVVDEAHRLKNEMAYGYKGDNQIEDIISSSRIVIFFVDDRQRIRPEDIGSSDEIARIAKKYNADLHEFSLDAQFRCAGAKDFIAWVEKALQIDSSARTTAWDRESFDFRIYSTPNKLFKAVKEKNDEGFKARLVAGYAWDWTSLSENNDRAQILDVSMPEYDFAMPWNQRTKSELWAILPNGLEQIGCVHTIQGLEFDYIGVIIGNDLRYNRATGKVEAVWNEYKDKAGKKGLKNDPMTFNALVKNIYRILLSRGMRGCYVFCRDKNLRDYLQGLYDSKLEYADYFVEENNSALWAAEGGHGKPEDKNSYSI